ncbi:MAG: rRNA maturation RNase YbeY [Candidatus Aminicenantes bacterium]|nr:rRNA maturation RNase YbeY [Candidatus Aminicenantes bacterium]
MIEIINQQNRYWIRLKKFKDLLKKLVEHRKLKDPEVTLVFVDTKTIKRLNKKYLKRNAPTDVLSFPLGEKSADGKFYLGDIVISVPQAFKQCFSQKHGLERELEILTIHGFLHLLGLDHSKGFEEEEKKIHRLVLEG